MPKRINFIAIEGGDGSGKHTQTELLCSFLKDELGKPVLELTFPQYGDPSAYYLERYLRGEFGTNPDDIDPDLAALPFMIDRFAARTAIEAQLAIPGGIVVTDRYVASNLAHQGTKVADAEARKAFYERTMQTEYGILGIPRPGLNIVLLVPSKVAQANVDKKGSRDYVKGKKRDIHEGDASHLDRAKANYEELCELYPDEFMAIQCMSKDGKMRSIEDIQTDIRKLIGDLITIG